jgi:hypothetical protein
LASQYNNKMSAWDGPIPADVREQLKDFYCRGCGIKMSTMVHVDFNEFLQPTRYMLLEPYFCRRCVAAGKAKEK